VVVADLGVRKRLSSKSPQAEDTSSTVEPPPKR